MNECSPSDTHDWRLWKRDPYYVAMNVDASANPVTYVTWPLGGHNEVWYCTRCRLIEERQMALEERSS